MLRKRIESHRQAGDTAGDGLGQLRGLRNNTHPKWWKDPGLRKLNAIILLITVCSVNNGFDASLINNLQAITTWQKSLGNPDSSMIGVFGAVQVAGAWLGSALVPPVSDRWGRKRAILLGVVIVFIGGLLQTFAYSQAQYIVGRMVVGFGDTFVTLPAHLLINEISHPRIRFHIAGYFQIIWYLGSVFASWLCYGLRIRYPESDWVWRGPTLLIAVLAVFMLSIYVVAPESPRWLIAKGRDAEAEAMLLKYHANGAEQDDMVDGEIREIKAAFELDKAYVGKTWPEIFRHPGDRRRMTITLGLSFCSLWTGQQIVSYYNTQILTQAGITSVLQQLGMNGGLAIFDLFCAAAGAAVSGFVGRRPMFLFSYVGQLISCAICTGVSARYAATQNVAYGYASIAFIWLASGFWNLSMNPIVYPYQVEIHSYSTRAKGISLYIFSLQTQAIVQRYVNPIGLANLKWKFYIIYTSFYVVELIFIYFAVVETRGRTLEEVAEIFDGVQIREAAVSNAEGGGELAHTGSEDEKIDDKGEAVISVFQAGR